MSFVVVVATAAAVAASVLGLGFLLAGPFMLKQWGLDAGPTGLVLARRIGAIYLGLAVMMIGGRSASPSTLRSAVASGAATFLALLAVLGIYEFRSKRVSTGIAVSVVVETALAVGFFWVA